jgi:hypothetical protein
MGGVQFTVGAARRIAAATLRIERDGGAAIDHRPPVPLDNRARYQGVLEDDLEAPDDGRTEPTSSRVRVWVPAIKPESDDERDDMIASEMIVAIVNRDETLSGSAGTYCRIERIGGEWMLYYLACS